jgi:hypothetical protein
VLPGQKGALKNGIASEDGFFQHPSTGVCLIRSCHALTVTTRIPKGILYVPGAEALDFSGQGHLKSRFNEPQTGDRNTGVACLNL